MYFLANSHRASVTRLGHALRRNAARRVAGTAPILLHRTVATTTTPRELPPLKQNWTYIIPLTVAIGGAWFYFIIHATNDEKASASIVKQIATNVRESPLVADLLGDNIQMEGSWWLPGGKPWIAGKVEMPKGLVDISFRISGSKGAGVVYFTSIRRKKGVDFTNLRYKIIRDDGIEVDILPSVQDAHD